MIGSTSSSCKLRKEAAGLIDIFNVSCYEGDLRQLISEQDGPDVSCF